MLDLCPAYVPGEGLSAMMRMLSLGALAPTAAVAAVTAIAIGGCGSQSQEPAHANSPTTAKHASSSSTSPQFEPTASRTGVGPPSISVVSDPAKAGSSWRVVSKVDRQPAVWAEQAGAVTLLRFDQGLVHLALHAGSEEPAGSGWPGGNSISRGEAHTVIAGFNGGFKLYLPQVGFVLRGRVGVPLHRGLASVVTYADGRTDIGAWGSEVPRRHAPLASVLQNLQPLIDNGRLAATLQSCVQECWGATLGGGVYVARSALGITADGQLLWAGGESLSPTEIADALLHAGARRAIQLDINPEWVAGYLYAHRHGRLLAVQATPSQPGIPGQLLVPYNRDFFTVLANGGAQR